MTNPYELPNIHHLSTGYYVGILIQKLTLNQYESISIS